MEAIQDEFTEAEQVPVKSIRRMTTAISSFAVQENGLAEFFVSGNF